MLTLSLDYSLPFGFLVAVTIVLVTKLNNENNLKNTALSDSSLLKGVSILGYKWNMENNSVTWS